jgi:hypothetical protein
MLYQLSYASSLEAWPCGHNTSSSLDTLDNYLRYHREKTGATGGDQIAFSVISAAALRKPGRQPQSGKAKKQRAEKVEFGCLGTRLHRSQQLRRRHVSTMLICHERALFSLGALA